MKNSEIYKIAILALLEREEITGNRDMSPDTICEVLYKLTQDWYWSREAEKDEEAKANEEALK